MSFVTIALLLSSSFAADVDVRHYTLEVDLGPESLTERVVIEADCERGVKSWTLGLGGGLEVSAVRAGEREVPFERSGPDLRLDLSDVDAAAKGGELVLELEVSGRPFNRFNDGGQDVVRTTVSEDITYIRSQYFWHPRAADDFATYAITVHARADWLVRTSGTELGRAESEGRRTWRFETRGPVADVGLAAGPWVELTSKAKGGFTVDAFVFPGHEQGAEYLLDVARRAGEHFTTRFGAIDQDRFTLVEMPAAFGEHSGYSEPGYFLIGGGTFEMAMSGVGGEELVAHEAAHNWWGGAVTFTNFASESLASWASLGFVGDELGEASARLTRARAVKNVVAAATDGKEVAFADIAPWGSGMDGRTYRVHAYDKGMMLLAMLEDTLGRKALDKSLARFLDEHRGTLVGYADLRAALAKAGRKASGVIEPFEVPGLPALELEYDTKAAGSKHKISGELVRTDDGPSIPLEVTILAVCEGGEAEQIVKLNGRRAKFRLTLAAAPDALIIDPGYRVLAARSSVTKVDADAVIKAAFAVANSPSNGDRTDCERTIESLRRLLRVGAGTSEGLCHTGIGRCLFRLESFDDARTEFAAALRLGGGGPFHRSWIQLRLGCMADLDGDREAALEHYARAQDKGASDASAQRAARFAETPYRGYAQDG
jgi:aminopeptidase N